jgi:uncharacterized protein (DUF342 family)
VFESPTKVCVGIHPDSLSEFADAKEGAESLQRRFEQIEVNLEQLERAQSSGHHDERIRLALEQLRNDKASVTADLSRALHRFHELREQLHASRESFVIVEDTIFKGAVVAFGTTEYHAPDKGARKTILHPGEEGVVEEGFNPYEAPELTFDEEADA